MSPVGLYHAHLACECMLKALIAEVGSKPTKGHNLSDFSTNLYELTHDPDLLAREFINTLAWLNPYQELGRYGPLTMPANDTHRVSKKSIQVRGFVSSQPSLDITKIDYVFALLRNKSATSKDLIDYAIENGTVPGWNFPISLKEVLITENKYISGDDL